MMRNQSLCDCAGEICSTYQSRDTDILHQFGESLVFIVNVRLA